jgi:DNA-directed RNA polymerase sigma subunit (sigma70/sigma32)
MSPYRERAIGIYDRRLQGESWKDIAAAFGVTCRRAQQIVREHEEWLAGHLHARNKTEQPLEAILDESALDLAPTWAVDTSRGLSSAERRRRMQRWWLDRYTLEELLELGREIGWA